MNAAERICLLYPELHSAQRIDITNVFDFINKNVGRVKIDPSRHFPNIAPPFPEALFFWKATHTGLPDMEVACRQTCTRDLLDGSWISTFMIWQFFGKDEVLRMPFTIDVVCDNKGRHISSIINNDDHRLPELMRAAIISNLFVVLYATALLHCKNVSLEDRAPNEKLSKKQLKKQGIPKLKYKVLLVSPMDKKSARESGMMLDSNGRSLHICRGHFKDYREGNGLFGRFKGIFWWEQSLRGSIDNGVVVKQYKEMAS